MHSEQHFGTWLPSPAAFCPPVPLRAVPPQPEQHHVHPPHTPELTWTPLAFFHNYWNPPGNLQQNQGTVNLENWADTSLIPADLQYKTEPYKHQHLGDFRALVTRGKLGISPKEPQFCDPHAGSTSAPPAAPTGCSPSQCPQDTPRKATVSTEEVTLLFSRFLLQCTMDGATVTSTGKCYLFSTIYPSSPNTAVSI